jgi:hypothetical protein
MKDLTDEFFRSATIRVLKMLLILTLLRWYPFRVQPEIEII